MTASSAKAEPEQREVGMNVDLPESLHRRFKVAAAQQGVTMKSAVIEAIENWLAALP